MQLFPQKLIQIWNGWEVRGLILVSLILQIILIIFGSYRKSTASVKVRIPVWSAYLIADSVAIIALGNLSNSQGDSEDNKLSEPGNALQSFWAPFLLLHLGGPDTITAYSLEDNELWLRHFFGLMVQVGVAFYIFFMSWSDNALTFIAIPMFITGIIKYGERTFVLYSSSTENFIDYLHSFPLDLDIRDQESSYLAQAFFLLKTKSAQLFANMIVDYSGRSDPSYCIIDRKLSDDAFKLVEAELGFMYDVLYTKATIVYSRFGICLRCISVFSSVSALIVFSIIVDTHSYPIADISLTYMLLVAAVFLEVYALILFIVSDWTELWLIKLKVLDKNLFQRLHRFAGHISSVIYPYKRWSRSMAQYNLISSCLKENSATRIGVLIRKLVDVKYWYLTREDVDIKLQEVIFKHLQLKSNIIIENFDDHNDKVQSLKELLDRRGDYVIEQMNFHDESHQWSTTEVDFEHSLLVWYIATNLCYYHRELDTSQNLKAISKQLSDYMLYLLVFCPSMLSKRSSFEKKYEDTCKAIKSYILKPNEISEERCQMASACKVLIEDVKDNLPVDDMSVLHVGCRLAKRLLIVMGGNEDKLWEMISEIWVEMLTYAANRCAWKEHGQQLRNGGELLTHVSLLMAHLGLSGQYEEKKTSVWALPEREWLQLL